ncbi:glycosyltransferase family 2 protein [Arthrobacter sp. SIMBA_036]|uniref:glycosyltransferase family 2 protein n=1 Tax=Arthrobacter sp. SIMBA_036 TaxID=3085778 RepID=UPI00397A60C0
MTMGGGMTVESSVPSGAIIIPAHNESAVIARTLDSLAEVLGWGTVEVIVACNGCTDGTEVIASQYAGVRVLQVGQASKAAALNAGDQATGLWPRLYLDADIEVSAGAVRSVFEALERGDVLAARPAFRYDYAGASFLVRAYYRARSRVPGNARGLWGSGAYALGVAGHERLGAFPLLTGDDYYVDRLFGPREKAVLDTEPVVVRTPRTSAALLAVLRRTYRGNAQQDAGFVGASAARTLWELLASVRGPLSAGDAAVYAVFAVAGRRRSLKSRRQVSTEVVSPGLVPVWERDESSR